MKLLIDVKAKKWIEENSEHKSIRWMNTCWEMYKKVPDNPSLSLLKGAVDDVMRLSGGIIMVSNKESV